MDCGVTRGEAAMSRTLLTLASAGMLFCAGCYRQNQNETLAPQGVPASYFDNSKHPDAWSGGARLIPISTLKGPHKVWIKRVGNNPRLKLLLLTGGPGLSHAYLEVMDSFLPAEGVEYYHYDQLETGSSDRPDDDSLWTLPRYVDRPGEMALRAPYVMEEVSMTALVLRARRSALGALLDRYLNIPARGHVRYVPAAPFVIVCTYG